MTRKRATLTFHFGGLLDDPPSGFVTGSGKLLRKLEFGEPGEIQADEGMRLLAQAVSKYAWFKEHRRELT